jgi:hypothetical protein
VGAAAEIFRSVALHHRDGQGGEEVTHGRIGMVVRSGYMKSLLLQHAREGCHSGPAYSHQVHMVRLIGGSVQIRRKRGT